MASKSTWGIPETIDLLSYRRFLLLTEYLTMAVEGCWHIHNFLATTHCWATSRTSCTFWIIIGISVNIWSVLGCINIAAILIYGLLAPIRRRSPPHRSLNIVSYFVSFVLVSHSMLLFWIVLFESLIYILSCNLPILVRSPFGRDRIWGWMAFLVCLRKFCRFAPWLKIHTCRISLKVPLRFPWSCHIYPIRRATTYLNPW